MNGFAVTLPAHPYLLSSDKTFDKGSGGGQRAAVFLFPSTTVE